MLPVRKDIDKTLKSKQRAKKGWETMRELSIEDISKQHKRLSKRILFPSTEDFLRKNRDRELMLKNRRQANVFSDRQIIEEGDRIERFKSMIHQWGNSEYIQLLQKYHEQQYIYKTTKVIDDAKIHDIRSSISEFKTPVYYIAGHGTHIFNRLIAVPENIVLIMSCARGQNTTWPEHKYFDLSKDNQYYYPGMLIDEMTFDFHLSYPTVEHLYKIWRLGGIMRIKTIFDRILLSGLPIDKWNLGVDLSSKMSPKDMKEHELKNILRLNDDSIIHRDEIIKKIYVKLSYILKQFRKLNKTPCTIVIDACRPIQNQPAVITHACGRYGQQNVSPFSMLNDRNDLQIDQHVEHINIIEKHRESMIFNISEQNDITHQSGCFNPRNNFAQAIYHIDERNGDPNHEHKHTSYNIWIKGITITPSDESNANDVLMVCL